MSARTHLKLARSSSARRAADATPRAAGSGAVSRQEAPKPAVTTLPWSLRVYVGVVCTAAVVIMPSAITGVGATPPAALSALLLTSLLASLVKVEIPISGNVSTLTACHVIDLITLIMYGPHAAVIVAAWGGWTQCTFRSRERNPFHQTAFSIASLALAMWVAGLVFIRFGGSPVSGGSPLHWEALGAAATVSFVLNSGLVAGAVALSTSKRLFAAWFSFFASWPSYVIGAILAATIVAGLQQQSFWLAPLLVAALVLIHRNHHSVVERINDAMTDPLTGLYNQRFVAAHVEREIARARRSGESVAMAVLDVDHFKRINDCHGHAAGDDALRRIALALMQSVRTGDVCARYGGDEFVVVMPNCREPEARRRILELQEAVAAAGHHGQGVGELRISAGVAVFPGDADCFETLFTAADGRMYQCKRTGHAAGVLAPAWRTTDGCI